ncbi:hypothetical protein [Candidatus Halobonum tyrrellensis]|uniref:hypothetical protein n=1 Tax=Candidatus Halobonum tyrrellensis TaxID=1431545 RepID=UPI00126885C8|nr:hypothetical protein [Candidatus Halobonum tyrrellensis]
MSDGDDERKSALEGLIGPGESEEPEESAETEEPSPTEETQDGDDNEDVSSTSNTSPTEETKETQETKETEETRLVEETHDLHMYLPESRYRELMSMYKRLDGEYYAETGEELEKNRQYFDAVVATALEHDDEIRERLGL